MEHAFSIHLAGAGIDPILIVAALMATLPVLQPSRTAIARLLRKAYPGSHLQFAVMSLAGRPFIGRRRSTVLDVALVLGPVAAVPVVMLRPDPLSITVGLGACLLLLALFDLRYRQLPDELTLPLVALGLVAGALNGMAHFALAGAVGAGTAVWLIAEVFRRLRGVDGIGGGDIKLMAAMGAWLGPVGAAVAIAAAALGALAAEIAIQLVRTGRVDGTVRIAFGAYLAAGFWLAWCGNLGLVAH